MKCENIKAKVNMTLNKIENKKYFYIIPYTMLFLITFGLMFATFFFEGRSFIWKGDGYSQHLKVLMYIRKYYMDVLEFKVFPSYDFQLGLGGNVFTTLTYYGFFDPINMISILIPFRYTEYLYSFLVVIRVYLSGLTFILMCVYFGKKKLYAIFGSLVYISTTYVLFIAIKHPFFLNPMIYLPILVIGLDLILQKKKPYLFIFGISFSALSGFYFLYMMTIMLFLYANIRFFELYKQSEQKIKEYVFAVLRTILYYALGIGLVAIVLLPHILAFLESNRLEKVENFYSFMDFSYYKYMFSLFYGKGGDLNFSISSLVFFVLIITFFKYQKNRKMLLGFVAISVIGLGVPYFGKMMNGFSYPSNRWMFGTGLLLSYLFVDSMEEILERKYYFSILSFLGAANALYILYYLLRGNKYQIVGILLVDIAFAFVYLFPKYREKKGQVVAKSGSLFIILLAIIGNASIMGIMTHHISGYINLYKKYENFAKYEKSQEVGFAGSKYAKEEQFFRVDGSDFKLNQGMLTGVPNSTLYFSIINPHIGEFFDELQIANHRSKISFSGMDGRVVAGNLISNKYFIASTKEKGEVPYGYKLKIDQGSYGIYENKNFLPFGYTYDKYITYEEVKDSFSLDKEANMLDMVYLEEEPSNMEKGKLKTHYTELPFEVELGDKMKYQPNQYLDFSTNLGIPEEEKEREEENSEEESEGTIKLDKYFKLWFEEDKKRETYLYIKSLLLPDSYPLSELYISSDNVSKKDLIRSKKSFAYFGRNDLLFHLGNANHKKRWCKLNVQKKINYPLSDVKIFSVSQEEVANKIKKLKKNKLENVKFGIDRISGNIHLDRAKILTMSIPYEKGWTAYVNGKEEPILRGNYMFSCLALEAGEHEVEMRYKTPGIGYAIGLTFFSWLVFIGMLTLERVGKRRTEKEEGVRKSNEYGKH